MKTKKIKQPKTKKVPKQYLNSEKNRIAMSNFFPEDYSFNVSDIFAACPYPLNQLIHGGRHGNLPKWRQILMFYKFMSGLTLDECGDYVGRDHSTVLHSISLVKNAMEGYDAPLLKLINEVIQISESGVVSTVDASMNEMISIAYFEQEFFKNFPNLAEKKKSFLFGMG